MDSRRCSYSVIPVNIRSAHSQVSFHINTNDEETLHAKKNVDKWVEEERKKEAVELREDVLDFSNKHHDQKEKITNCQCNQALLKSGFSSLT